MGRRFSITVRGRLGTEFSSAFDEVELRHSGSDTVISGNAHDQTHLDGILAHLRNLGLEVIGLETWAIPASHARSEPPPDPIAHDTRRRQ